jgi:hypothetical protein
MGVIKKKTVYLQDVKNLTILDLHNKKIIMGRDVIIYKMKNKIKIYGGFISESNFKVMIQPNHCYNGSITFKNQNIKCMCAYEIGILICGCVFKVNGKKYEYVRQQNWVNLMCGKRTITITL